MDDRNLYAPPAAAVADPVGTQATRPREVTWAIILIWGWAATYLVSALPSTVIEFINGGRGIFYILGFLLVPVAIPAAIMAWITDRIGAGRRWARILACVLIGAYIVTTAEHWSGLHMQIMEITRLALSAIPLVLLFTPRANLWFKPKD